MENASLIVLLALLQYVWFTVRVGVTRGKFNVNAPACRGDETWERSFRIQQNTMEQLIVLIPASYAFAFYMSPMWVLLPGVVFIVGRFIYSAAYMKDPGSRAPGMVMTLLANAVLIIGALIGLLMGMF
jgi:glutathione S-transferase